MKSMPSKILILLDIRSAQNVGALFRTADAAGIEHIYLVGITPTPLDRFGRARSDIAKTALGAEQSVSWVYAQSIEPLLVSLKKDHIQIIAIEQSPTSMDYKNVHIEKSVAFILGNEVAGIAPEVLSLCDIVTHIPMKGIKESLNVAVAGGIALFRMLGV